MLKEGCDVFMATSKSKKQTKCYIYTRVSISMQVEGYNLDAQRDKLIKYAEFSEMAIAGEYSDEGKSDKSVEGRAELQARWIRTSC